MAAFVNCMILLFVLCIQIQWSQSKKSCESGRVCSRSECCLANVRPIGKRSVRRRSLSWGSGTCQPRGDLGSGCIVPFGNPPSWNDLVAMDTCPCQRGLKCVPDGSGAIVVAQGYTGTCHPESQVVRCDSASDCPAGECCVAPLRGKRALPSQKGGVCLPIPKEGGSCHKTVLQVGDGMVASCPCADGLKCVPDGGREVPQGPTGTCQPESQVVHCASASDCPAGECCVAPLRGKRDLPSQKGGVCLPIPKEGGNCHTTVIQVGDMSFSRVLALTDSSVCRTEDSRCPRDPRERVGPNPVRSTTAASSGVDECTFLDTLSSLLKN
ncbi:hypothetical protein LSAT2_015401 [Lamellibrachia satsuma]|nr:hypothetical protein LSAT2_015401 [Lamellibrachia satsuma]